MSDLQDLISRIKAQNAEPYTSHSHSSSQPSLWAPAQVYHQSASSSPSFPPRMSSESGQPPLNLITPVASSNEQERSNKLLNLLKFNGQPARTSPPPGPLAGLPNITSPRSSLNISNGAQRDASSSDAIGGFPAAPMAPGALPSPLSIPGPQKLDSQKSPSSTPQDYLLNLLKPKAPSPPPYLGGSTDVPPFQEATYTTRNGLHTPRSVVEAVKEPIASHDQSELSALPGSDATGSAKDMDSQSASKSTLFSYVNPFEQLHSSSPLNRTPQPEAQAERKPIAILKHDHDQSFGQGSDRHVSASESHTLPQPAASPTAPTNGLSQAQSVSQLLGTIGDAVGKQADQALARAEAITANGKSVSPVNAPAGAVNGKHAADDDGVESNWESVEDEQSAQQEDFKVEVYNFPMKPFVSLQIKSFPVIQPIRVANLTVISRLKKEFDQIDRCLSTASQTHILYAQAATKKDNGGFRVIRQDTGDHKQVFRNSGERIFSVQLCSSALLGHDFETVLGTGVNGSVFWTKLAKSRAELFEDDDVEAHGFVMPPITSVEENTSGSPVKTRAKMSSRHPDYFAIARGKHIYIIAPETVKLPAYRHPATHKINTEAYFDKHSLKINTGKAGKDFCFSEDDSVIASLDKNGRFKFWDIRDLTARALDDKAEPHAAELREPLWTMNAAASGTKPDEKPSVSSIMFLDKDRPMSKGSALRYMIIGFRQNHILQLWDLGLGKAVQEIRLPHEQDGDAICSITYHPKTGIVAIGHPTRNSVYFIHLSAPKYNIPHMEQARFISMLASGDASLPKPDSTAIMSGLREFSFDKVGKLRSIDMLRTPVENASERDGADESLFELYVMHSKGVVCLNIKRDDLGWDVNSKMLYPKNALEEGIIEISELIQPQKLPDQGSSGDSQSAAQPKPEASKKEEQEPIETQVNKVENKVEVKKELSRQKSPNNDKRPVEETLPERPKPSAAKVDARKQSTQALQPDTVQLTPSKAKEITPLKDEASAPSTKASTAPELESLPQPQLEDLRTALGKQFDNLYQRIESDKRVQDAAAGAKQDALLRLVSSTLTENVDRSLSDIIATRIERDVIPRLTDTTTKLIDRKISESLPGQLSSSVGNAVKTNLPNTLQAALKEKEVQRTISEVTANQVAIKVQQQVSASLQQSLPKIVTEITQKLVNDVEQRIKQQFVQLEEQRQRDNAKIDELTGLVRSLVGTIEKMGEGQTALREEVIKLQAKATEDATLVNLAGIDRPLVQTEVDDPEITRITNMLMEGQYETATIEWIGSSRQAELFDKLFVRINPEYLLQVSPLVSLTVSAAITSSLETFVTQRLDWLNKVLGFLDTNDHDIRDVTPKIMEVISQRLQAAYMNLSEINPSDPNLKTISSLNRQVQEIRRVSG